LRAYVCAPRFGVRCRNLFARAARKMVSARRGTVGLMNETRTKMATREVRRWQRVYVDEAAWNDALDNLASGAWTLFGLWGEHDRVHLAAMDRDDLRIMTVAAKDGTYPSVAAKHPPATRLERTIYDLLRLRGIGTVAHALWTRR